jgi:hypothetical protein
MEESSQYSYLTSSVFMQMTPSSASARPQMLMDSRSEKMVKIDIIIAGGGLVHEWRGFS